jgi:hypothetical protein
MLEKKYKIKEFIENTRKNDLRGLFSINYNSFDFILQTFLRNGMSLNISNNKKGTSKSIPQMLVSPYFSMIKFVEGRFFRISLKVTIQSIKPHKSALGNCRVTTHVTHEVYVNTFHCNCPRLFVK